MSSLFYLGNRSVFSLAVTAAFTLLGQAHAGEASPVMLRVAGPVVGSAKEKPFEREQVVNDLVLGTKVKGNAKTNGVFKVAPCEEIASHGLQVVVTGTSVTKSVGRNGPAIIHSTTTTDFTAVAPLLFNVKKGIVPGDLSVTAESATTTDDIQSTQGGIAGTIIKKLASKKVEELREEAGKVAKELAIERIRGEVTGEITKRLAEVNQCLAGLLPVLQATDATDSTPIRLQIRKGELLVCVGTTTTDQATTLPKLQGTADVVVPTKAANPSIGEKLQQMTKPSEARPLTVAYRGERELPLQFERGDEWLIIRNTGIAKSTD